MKKRVAIIGAGMIANAHIRAYEQVGDMVEIVAIVDLYLDKAKALADSAKDQPDVFADAQEILDREDIDIVSVCTPPYTHAPLAVAFLDAGKHVIVEKPMAASLEECDRMIEAAERSGKKLSIIAQNRFHDQWWHMKDVLQEQLIGEPLHIQVDSAWWRGHSYYDLWWRGTWEKEGGGCTLNHAVHHIDMLQWYMGLPEEVTAVTANVAHDNAEVEDLSVAILSYKKALATVTSSVVHHGEEQKIIVQGEKAKVSVPWSVKATLSQENGFPKANPELEEEISSFYNDRPSLVHTGHAGQIYNVLQSIDGNESLLVDGKQGRNTLELITAIYKSATTKQAVRLPLDRNDDFYTRAGLLAAVPHFYEKTNSVDNFSKDEPSTVSGETKQNR
ncbi:putative dehydrogenase [Aureibacillus halotolerans]|uniref:Putative dehydrogenase n=2 Tax=Aureibacillus halotolerans TaxID=1508390 RepID=A0A4V3D607_9BACI|nr:putative dehydrogenase [Aureibacillus halotolerans]